MENKRRPNYVHLGNGFYLVRTQAGFRKVMKTFCKNNALDFNYSRGFPREYPSIVFISVEYEGYEYARANCVKAFRFQRELNEQLLREKK